MQFVIVFEQLGKRVRIYPVEVEEEGELSKCISDACRRFRQDTGISLFDNVHIRVERDV